MSLWTIFEYDYIKVSFLLVSVKKLINRNKSLWVELFSPLTSILTKYNTESFQWKPVLLQHVRNVKRS